MADAVTNQVVFSGKLRHVVHLTSQSDGTGESGVVKVDLSELLTSRGLEPTYSVIDRIFGTVGVFSGVELAWDHTENDVIAVIGPGSFDFDWSYDGGIVDPRSDGGTGDIVLTTAGATASAIYDITIELRLKA